MKRRGTIFYSRVELVRIVQKARWHMLRRTFVFESGGICGSRSGFQCVRGTKHRHLFFMLEWNRYGFDKKRIRTRYAKLLFCTSDGICDSHSAFCFS
jgi:hypothetical protein